MHYLPPILFATAGFIFGFLSCFMIYTDKTLKNMYDHACARFDLLLDFHRWHEYPTEKPDPDSHFLVISRIDDQYAQLGFAVSNSSSDGWQSLTIKGPVTHWARLPQMYKPQ